MVAAATISQSNRPSRHGCARQASMAESYSPSDPTAEDCVQSVTLHPDISRPRRPWHPMAENYARFAAHVYKQYVWGLRYIDAPVLRDRETDGGAAGLDERLYYTQDGNLNVACPHPRAARRGL